MNQEEYTAKITELGDGLVDSMRSANRILKAGLVCAVVSTGLMLGGLGLSVYKNHLASNLPSAPSARTFAEPSLQEMGEISWGLASKSMYSIVLSMTLAGYSSRRKHLADRKYISFIRFIDENLPEGGFQ